MKVIEIDIDCLALDPANARKHDKKNLDAIKGSLARFGQQKPIVIDQKNVVRAGNGTLLAARELGWKKIQVYKSDLGPTELAAFALADNRTAELAEWDDEVLKRTLAELDDLGFDVGEIGFDFEPEAQAGTAGLTDPDDIPEVPQNIHGVERGQIWQLGGHRLMCGDSTSRDDVERLMRGEKADMVFTDPPYGIDEKTDRAYAAPSRVAKGGKFKKIEGDQDTVCALSTWLLVQAFSPKLQIWWGANHYANGIDSSPSWIVWDKREEDKERDVNSDCELAWCSGHNKSVRIFRHKWKGLIKASEHGQARIHPTQKPIALAEWCFESYGEPKSVLDLFLGSGSTLIACEKTGRKCFGMEIDPHYCSVIIERWQKFTGREARKIG